MTAAKSERLLQIYSKLANGEILKKKELAQHFHVTERSIQRDIEALRCLRQEHPVLPHGESCAANIGEQRDSCSVQDPAGEPLHAPG